MWRNRVTKKPLNRFLYLLRVVFPPVVDENERRLSLSLFFVNQFGVLLLQFAQPLQVYRLIPACNLGRSEKYESKKIEGEKKLMNIQKM